MEEEGVCYRLRKKKKIITRPLDVWIKKTRDERGFGGKSLILERIPTLSHTKGMKGGFFF